MQRRVSLLAFVAVALTFSAMSAGGLASQASQSRPAQPPGGAAGANTPLPSRDQAAADVRPRSGTGIMRGRVTRSDNGLPIAHATVAILGEALDGLHTVQTDENGRYEFS